MKKWWKVVDIQKEKEKKKKKKRDTKLHCEKRRNEKLKKNAKKKKVHELSSSQD